MAELLPEHLKDLAEGPRGPGFEIFFVNEPGERKEWHGGYAMVYFNGIPLGMVQGLKLEVDPTGTFFRISLSQVIQMRNVHGVSESEIELICNARGAKRS